MEFKIALIGFGNVGQGFARLIEEKKAQLLENYGVKFSLVAISDPVKGSVFQEGGIDVKKALELIKRDGNLKSYDKGVIGWDSFKTISESNADVIVELTPTNIETGEPAFSHIKLAFERGKHVVTTNKGPVALFYRQLKEISDEKGLAFKFEGTVLSGTPVFSFYFNSLRGAFVKRIKGILNGTTNFILTQMHNGKSYDEALETARRLGYAEADPSADVRGLDAMAKIIILSNVIMGSDLKPSDVEVEGIINITSERIRKAILNGCKIKLISDVWRDGDNFKAVVSPQEIPVDDFFYHIDGAMNSICFSTDVIGDVFVAGSGAGGIETGYAILSDLLDIYLSVYAGGKH
jgi:homoserine dehydrogenase